MTPALLADVGRALYGTRWQSELARALGVSGRTIRRWLVGSSPVPAGIIARLAAHVDQRRDDLSALASALH